MKLFTLITILLGFTVSSCCTVRKPYETVVIQSNPPGANITIDGYDCGKTPQEVKLDARYPHSVAIEKPYFPPKYYSLKSNQSFKKLSSNLWFPVGGGVVGFGAGAAIGSTTGPFWIIIAGLGAVAGAAAGAIVGVVGTGVDVYSGNSSTLSDHKINVDL